jgi:hypothetical protein
MRKVEGLPLASGYQHPTFGVDVLTAMDKKTNVLEQSMHFPLAARKATRN